MHKSKTGSGVESDEGAETTDMFIGPMTKDPDKPVIETQSKTGAPEEGNEKVKETLESWAEEVERSTRVCKQLVAPEQKKLSHAAPATQPLLTTPLLTTHHYGRQQVKNPLMRGRRKNKGKKQRQM